MGERFVGIVEGPRSAGEACEDADVEAVGTEDVEALGLGWDDGATDEAAWLGCGDSDNCGCADSSVNGLWMRAVGKLLNKAREIWRALSISVLGTSLLEGFTG